MHLWSFGGGVELRLGRVQQFLPGLLELLYALVLEHDEDVGQVDAHGLELVEDLLRLAALPVTVSPVMTPRTVSSAATRDHRRW